MHRKRILGFSLIFNVVTNLVFTVRFSWWHKSLQKREKYTVYLLATARKNLSIFFDYQENRTCHKECKHGNIGLKQHWYYCTQRDGQHNNNYFSLADRVTRSKSKALMDKRIKLRDIPLYVVLTGACDAFFNDHSATMCRIDNGTYTQVSFASFSR